MRVEVGKRSGIWISGTSFGRGRAVRDWIPGTTCVVRRAIARTPDTRRMPKLTLSKTGERGLDRSLVQSWCEGPGARYGWCGPRTVRAQARVGRVGFAALVRGGSRDAGSRGGFLLDPRGSLAGPTGRCGTKESPRRRMLLYAHLARYRGRGLCRPVWPDPSPSVTSQQSRPLADPTSTQLSSATSPAARSFI